MARLRRPVAVERPASNLDCFVAEDWRDDDADLQHPLVAEFGFGFIRYMQARARWSDARHRAGLSRYVPTGPAVD